MSQIRSFDEALDFYPSDKASLRSRFGGHVRAVRYFLEALAEGHAAARRYEEFRQRGLTHDQAASKVFADHFN